MTKLNQTEARQGVTGRNVRYVLVISLCLAVAAMITLAVIM